jgi:integrase
MGVKVREKVKDSGEWWVFINHNGKRRSKKIGDKRTANNVAKEIRERLARGELGISEKKCPTVGSFGDKYVNSANKDWALNTRANYKALFKNHIKPSAIGKMSLDRVAMLHVKDFIGTLNERGLAKNTIQFIITVLHSIFEEARVYEYVSLNPCSRTGKFIVGGDKKKKINPYTPTEAAEVVKRSKSLGLLFHAIIVLLIRTGVRIGEALALEWRDINFDERTALVARNWNYIHKRIGPTKTKRAREIDLTPYVAQVLKELKDKTGGLDSEPVFIRKGTRLSYDLVKSAHNKVSLRKGVTLQDLRHTYATIRIAKGDNIVDVSAQLGHKKTSMTLDVYAQWLPRYHKGQVDELDNLHLSAPYTHPAEARESQVSDFKAKLH